MSIVSVFQEMKCIHGFCPCCGELFRLSDATIFTAGPPPKTEFDRADDQQRKLERAMERFEEAESAVRAAAINRGQQEAKKRLKKIAPFFTRRRIDPQDVKVIFNPVNYVVFRGLNAEGVSAVELIDAPATTSFHEEVQNSIGSAIKAGNLEWATLRIDETGQVAMER